LAGQILYDISPLITPDLKVWPGDTPPSREVLLDMKKGDSLNLSTLHATVHLGAHVDAPSIAASTLRPLSAGRPSGSWGRAKWCVFRWTERAASALKR